MFIQLTADMVFGLLWYRILATDRPLTDDDIATIERLLTQDPTGRSTNG